MWKMSRTNRCKDLEAFLHASEVGRYQKIGLRHQYALQYSPVVYICLSQIVRQCAVLQSDLLKAFQTASERNGNTALTGMPPP